MRDCMPMRTLTPGTKMGLVQWFVIGVVVAFAALVLDSLIKAGEFEHVYDHQPGKCTKYEMDGSEDIVLLPNGHALISSGYFLWEFEQYIPAPDSCFYLFDMNHPDPHSQQPVRLEIEGDFNEKEFFAHGMSHWITENGSIILYAIAHHRNNIDTVDSFLYNPDKPSLRYLNSFQDPLLRSANDLVMVAEDEFYATIFHYFDCPFLKNVEPYFRLPWKDVIHHNGKTDEWKVAISGLTAPNGIAVSNNGKFIFMNELLYGQVLAFTRNKDNTLTKVDQLQLQMANDNVFVSPDNGHLWVGIMPKVRAISDYFLDHSIPIAGRVIHVAIDEESETPFSEYELEEVFATTGHQLSAPTIAIYHQGRLLIGTIMKDLMYCDAPHLMHG